MKKVVLPCIMVLMSIFFLSCVENSNKFQGLVEERDSLQNEIQTLNTEYENTLQVLNDIESGFQEIRVSEGRLKVEMESIEGSKKADIKQKFSDDLNTIKEILADNRTKIKNLQSALNKSGKQNKSLMATIERYEKEISDKSKVILQMQEELAKKQIVIEGLTEDVAELNTFIQQKTEEHEGEFETIARQSSDLNKAFYCVGTRKELADAAIIGGTGLLKSREVLKGDFDADYFTTVDKRDFATLVIDSKTVKLLSNHPEGSYTLTTSEDGKTTLAIEDEEKFWSTTNYLVIKK